MIKFLHAADFHLDSAFSALSPEQSAQRRTEQRLALETLAQLCNENECDLLLLSGDLFDSARVYRDTLEALHRCFLACNAEIFISPGNHDYLAPGSPYLTEPWPQNVHIFTSPQMQRIPIERLNCDVYGAAFTAPESPALLENFHVSREDRLNIIVLHGDMLQASSVYNPISKEAAAASGADYLALGHIHASQALTCGNTAIAWPGCLAGRGFDECGQKGVLLGELSSDGCKTRFLPLPSRRYEILSVEAGEDPLASITAALPAQTLSDCYRIVLTGESAPIDTAVLTRALESTFFSLSIRDHTVPKQALWSACGEDTLRGQFLRILKDRYDAADEQQRRVIVHAAQLTLSLMDNREVQV